VTPGIPAASQFPTPPDLFTVDSLGGWPTLTKQFFDPATGVVTKIDQSLGVSTSK
jgi:sulfate/thiosulfate transport system substrate-binding protein